MKLNPIVSALSAAYLASVPMAMAQESNQAPQQGETSDSPKLELIEVTSQRRVQNIQDVPISVQAFSGPQMEKVGIDKIEDLQMYVPNLNLTETGISTQMFVRGVGSGNNQGFEQSVVQFVDGVSYARQQLSRAPFFDMERVEVLRGPQSILFGKNAIGGALNFTTAEVQEYTAGKFSAHIGEFGIREYQGILNGELYDGKLFGRIALRHYEEDGYIYNQTLDRDEPNRSDQTVRVKLLYLLNDDWKLKLKYEKNDFETIGRQIEVLQDIGNPGNPFGTTLTAGFGLNEAIPEAELNYVRAGSGEESFNHSDNITFEITGLLGDLEFESRTASLQYDYQEICDCDFIDANILTLPMDEDYEQFSQEFRVASDPRQTLSWQAGVFYQKSELDFKDATTLPEAAIGDANTGVLPTALFALSGSTAVGQAVSGISSSRVFAQDTESYSIFAQLTYQLTDATQIMLGARWSNEDKTGFRSINILDLDTNAPTTNPLSSAVLLGNFGIDSEQANGHYLTGERSETAFDPNITVQHYLQDDFMLYASWSKGSKSGGYDARANQVTSFEFDEEDASAFEAGFKSTFWDQRAKLNVAFYHTSYEGLQVSQFDGTLGFVVGNADADMQGVEIDGSFALTDDLTLSYSAAYLDHEFTDYTNGNCYYRQQFDTENPDLAARYNAETGLCDYTGLRGQYAPEFTGNMNINYFVDISDDAVMNISLNYNYSSEQKVHQNLDPDFVQDALGRVDLNVSIDFENWGIELMGRNVTDEQYITTAGNASLSGAFGADTVYGFVAPPRIWSLRGYYTF
ncbi:TonB-dependent receptor [Alteromonas lipolytica]|uniref:TonB-dependent receptor n=1 Tax=Alteromonas lipolytica TaxID=1856405 RepID=A0A1E8FD11_9ALTE|nr:TonB-dependent receptor [Alteromonas lipolytica]OFI33478.1 hypothetical protein BFC17_04250 [Alteromonas lipolytica]GGF59322.1 TonB-dependent receptor [Alteromonas lipolytica]